jgi:hypothetical protein
MAIFVASNVADLINADKRRHPAIYGEAPSSGQLGSPRIDEIYLKELQGTANSNAVRREQIYSRLRDQLRRLEKLQRGWDSYDAEAPSGLARVQAEKAMEFLRYLNAEPVAVLPSADGGVGVCFNNGSRYGQIEFLNDGEAHALLYGGPNGPQAWQIDLADRNALTESWNRISAYL